MAFNPAQAYFAFQRSGVLYRMIGSQISSQLQDNDRVVIGQGTTSVSVTVDKIKESHSALDLRADMVPYTDTTDGVTYKVSLETFKGLL